MAYVVILAVYSFLVPLKVILLERYRFGCLSVFVCPMYARDLVLEPKDSANEIASFILIEKTPPESRLI